MAQTWTYTDPAGSYKDAVRLAIGDTDPAEPQLSDAEIAYLLNAETGALATAAPAVRVTVIKGAIACCDALSAKYSRHVDFSLSGHSESSSQRAAFYAERRDKLVQELASHGVTPYFGGRSRSEKASAEADSDATQPAFKRGIHDNPENGALDTSLSPWTDVYPNP